MENMKSLCHCWHDFAILPFAVNASQVSLGQPGYPLYPNFHMLLHQFYWLCWRADKVDRVESPLADGCQVDEGFVCVAARLSRRVSPNKRLTEQSTFTSWPFGKAGRMQSDWFHIKFVCDNEMGVGCWCAASQQPFFLWGIVAPGVPQKSWEVCAAVCLKLKTHLSKYFFDFAQPQASRDYICHAISMLGIFLCRHSSFVITTQTNRTPGEIHHGLEIPPDFQKSSGFPEIFPEDQKATRKTGNFGMDWLFLVLWGRWSIYIYISAYDPIYFLKMSNSPPVRWGLLDFMLTSSASSSSSSSSSSSLVVVLSALCRTSTATICARCSLPDLRRDHLSPVFPPGPQPKPSEPNVPCRTSTATICGQCSLPGLNRQKVCQKICQKEGQKICQKEC